MSWRFPLPPLHSETWAQYLLSTSPSPLPGPSPGSCSKTRKTTKVVNFFHHKFCAFLWFCLRSFSYIKSPTRYMKLLKFKRGPIKWAEALILPTKVIHNSEFWLFLRNEMLLNQPRLLPTRKQHVTSAAIVAGKPKPIPTPNAILSLELIPLPPPDPPLASSLAKFLSVDVISTITWLLVVAVRNEVKSTVQISRVSETIILFSRINFTRKRAEILVLGLVTHLYLVPNLAL